MYKFIIEKARIKECKGKDSFAYDKYMLIMLYCLFTHMLNFPKGNFIWFGKDPGHM